MYNDEFELTFDLADAGPKKEQRRPTLPEPEEAAAAAPPVQETRETPVSAAPENTPVSTAAAATIAICHGHVAAL